MTTTTDTDPIASLAAMLPADPPGDNDWQAAARAVVDAADPTFLASEIAGEVSSALNGLHDAILDCGDSQEAWQDAAEALTEAIVAKALPLPVPRQGEVLVECTVCDMWDWRSFDGWDGSTRVRVVTVPEGRSDGE